MCVYSHSDADAVPLLNDSVQRELLSYSVQRWDSPRPQCMVVEEYLD
jgi:hypothetical protein